LEVDLIAQTRGETMPFEVKYRNQITAAELIGMQAFCKEHEPSRAYIVTKSCSDFRMAENIGNTQVLHIPAALLCYWMGRMELIQQSHNR
jgi:predicted AAA+ superfamily ATPase